MGSNGSRTTNGNTNGQKKVVLSIIKYIINPLNNLYNLNIYINAICSSLDKKILLRKMFNNIKNVKIFHIYNTSNGQLHLIRKSIKNIINKNLALLIIRIDCVFRRPIPFKRLNFNCFYANFRHIINEQISDIMLFIPSFKLKLFLKTLDLQDSHLHKLYIILIKLNFDKNKLKYFLKYIYRSDTSRGWNPIYYMTGRKIAIKNYNNKDIEFDF